MVRGKLRSGECWIRPAWGGNQLSLGWQWPQVQLLEPAFNPAQGMVEHEIWAGSESISTSGSVSVETVKRVTWCSQQAMGTHLPSIVDGLVALSPAQACFPLTRTTPLSPELSWGPHPGQVGIMGVRSIHDQLSKLQDTSEEVDSIHGQEVRVLDEV